MKLTKEIRIKAEPDIPDNVVINLVSSVIAYGKVSNEGRSYCYVNILQFGGIMYRVETNSDTKSIMFYVFKEEEKEE